jgi:NAD(P)-dependent dehydrogenase (short-subunit alcohol dehydrogenase family)
MPPVCACAVAAAWYSLCLHPDPSPLDSEDMTNETTPSIDMTRSIGLLSGKVVLITGASRGIGAAAAELFAREGASVVLASRGTEALDAIVGRIRAAGGIADAVTTDLADPAAIEAALARVDELHGRLDGAFNNGAAIQDPGPLDGTSDEDIERMFRVNFLAHWTAMNAEAALMRRSGGGAIVNTSSIGSRRANPELPAYGAMKRALNSITETAAVTWGRDGIRVNGITPGGTATEMIDAWEAASPGVVARISASVPLGRFAEPIEVAEVAAWLLSDRASYVTGASVPVDGGAGA